MVFMLRRGPGSVQFSVIYSLPHELYMRLNYELSGSEYIVSGLVNFCVLLTNHIHQGNLIGSDAILHSQGVGEIILIIWSERHLFLPQ